jgi:biotin carboxyl carrier protein
LLLNFRDGEEMVTVEVARAGQDWRVVIAGQETAVEAFRERGGSWVVATDQGRRRLWVTARGDQRLVFCDGKVHVLDLPDPEQAADEDGATAGPGLWADMPGKVVKVLVAVGEQVASGQPVLILESMKMETELAAAMDGTVAAIHVENGQLVGQGDALVDITPDGEDEAP